MANDIVQTIAEARVDARSLSEFVFKPADFMVARRLAPSVRTLQYYVDFFNTLQSNIATSVSVAQSSLNNSVAEAQGKVAYIESTVQDAINNTAVEGGVLADTFVTVTANGVGTIARTQRDKNSDYISVHDFGAVGDGVTSDNVAVQAAIDYCHSLYLQNGAVVNLNYKSGKTYVLNNIRMMVGVNHICAGGGAVLLKTPAKPEQTEEQLKWRTIFTIETSPLATANLDDRVSIEGIVFDGNYNNMNWTFGTYNQQQGMCLKLYNASIPEGKRFKIKLKDVTFRNSVTDGVTISQNIDIIGSNIEAYECFRGGIVHTGGNTVAVFNNFVGDSANLHIEIDGVGSNGKYDLHATYNNFEIDSKLKTDAIWGGFYATPSDGSDITLNNFKCYSEGFYIQGGMGDVNDKNSVIKFNDSYITYGSSVSSVAYFPPNMVFSNTELHHVGGTGIGLQWHWKTSVSETSNRKAIFSNGCKFTSESSGAKEAIRSYNSSEILNNRFEFTDTFFSQDFEKGFIALGGFHGEFGDGCVFNSDMAVSITTLSSNANVRFGDIRLGDNCTSFIFCYLQSQTGNTIEFNGTTIPASKLAKDYTGDFNTVNGLLELTSTTKPSNQNKAWVNTVWTVVNAVAGKPFTYKNLSPTKATTATWGATSWITAAGVTASRPALGSFDVGTQYINTETNSVETWTGTAWVSATPSV